MPIGSVPQGEGVSSVRARVGALIGEAEMPIVTYRVFFQKEKFISRWAFLFQKIEIDVIIFLYFDTTFRIYIYVQLDTETVFLFLSMEPFQKKDIPAPRRDRYDCGTPGP